MVLSFYLFVSFLASRPVKGGFDNLKKNDSLFPKNFVEMDRFLNVNVLRNFDFSSFSFSDSLLKSFLDKYKSDNSFNMLMRGVKLSEIFLISIKPNFVRKGTLSDYAPIVLVFKFEYVSSGMDNLESFLSMVNRETLRFMRELKETRFFDHFVEFIFGSQESDSGLNGTRYRSNLLFIVASLDASLGVDDERVRRSILATIFSIPEDDFGDLNLRELSSYGENISIFRGIYLYASERIVFLLSTSKDNDKFEEMYLNVKSILPFLIVSESIIEFLSDDLRIALNKASLDKVIELTRGITTYISLLRSPRKSTSYYYERVFNKLIDNLEVDEIFKSAEKALDTSRYAIERAFDVARDYGNLVLSVVLGTPLFYPIVRGYLESHLFGLYLEFLSVLLTLLSTVFLYYIVRLIVWSWHIKRTLKIST